MRLLKAHVTNFRSAEDSEEFDIDQVTCLVGKNEAGKSAVLSALAALNPHTATPMTLNKERDYPRRFLTKYTERHPDGDAAAVTTTWELSDGEVARVEKEFGSGVLKSNQVKIWRRYNGTHPEWALPLDYGKARENVLKQSKLDAGERAPLKDAEETAAMIAALEKLPAATPKQKALLERLKGYKTITEKVQSILAPGLPFFMYFSNYDRMEGAVQIEQLGKIQPTDERYSGHRLFQEFLSYAGVPADKIVAVSTYETFNAQLQAASNNITDQILEYWTQNPDLEVQVRIEHGKAGDPPPFNTGTVARARIYNKLHRVDTPFSERSAGFVWFFSFLVKFAQVKDAAVPVVLLLDEPGLSLHGKAQHDLLRYINEKLAPHHQIIYSTHSPFMVSADQLMSARVVEDQVVTTGPRRVPIGTKVRMDVLTRDPDTLFPLQGALGYEITQTLFIGKHTLLVEGPSDILYLKALSSALAKAKRTTLDPRWTLCPSGGIGNIKSFVSLFGGNKIDVAVLADYSKGERSQVEKLRASTILKAGRVLTIHDYTGKPESDVEDLFESELFADLLNVSYGLQGSDAVTAAKLDSAEPSTPRLVKKAEAYFRVGVALSTPDFDHFRPSEWLIENPAFLQRDTPAVSATLQRAEKLISDLNALFG